MYSITCPFGHTHQDIPMVHTSEYWEDVEAAINRCRERAPTSELGRLADWNDRGTRIITPEDRVYRDSYRLETIIFIEEELPCR